MKVKWDQAIRRAVGAIVMGFGLGSCPPTYDAPFKWQAACICCMFAGAFIYATSEFPVK